MEIEQVIAFGTDNVGLERQLRFVQAACQITEAFPQALALILAVAGSEVALGTAIVAASQLQAKLALSRRCLRLFRFAVSFHGAWSLYVSMSITGRTWLEILSKSFLGMYGLLESVTIVDLLGVENLQIFGAERTRSLNQEAQMFWFWALSISALLAIADFLRTFGNESVAPDTRSNHVEEDNNDASLNEKPANKKQKNKTAITTNRSEGLSQNLGKTTKKRYTLLLLILANTLDMVLPAVAIGWLKIDTGLVGIAMLLSTIITSIDVWNRCKPRH